MQRSPLVSVLLPVHNGGEFLYQAVESVLRQTMGDFELLAHDDGSSDGSLDVLKDFAARDSRVIVSAGGCAGIVPALNTMISAARGRYLARMDADDVCQPERFARQVSHLEANPGCAAVGSRVTLIDGDGDVISPFIDDVHHGDIDAAHLRGGKSRICHPTAMMRAEAVRRVGGYDDRFRFAEDVDLFLRLAEVGTVCNLPDVLLDYRQHRSAIGALASERQRQSARLAAESACVRRGIALPSWHDDMGPEPSIADTHRKWAWWALMAGNVRTARKHARIAFVMSPWSAANFRLVACAVRGH